MYMCALVRAHVKVRVYVCKCVCVCLCLRLCVCMHLCVCACVCEGMLPKVPTSLLWEQLYIESLPGDVPYISRSFSASRKSAFSFLRRAVASSMSYLTEGWDIQIQTSFADHEGNRERERERRTDTQTHIQAHTHTYAHVVHLLTRASTHYPGMTLTRIC